MKTANFHENKRFSAIVLAAGRGTRMNSHLPKPLHPVAGTPMISRILESLKEAQATDIRVVVGHGKDLISQVVTPLGAQCFPQETPAGTADAVLCANIESLEEDVLILNGDHPLVNSTEILFLKKQFEKSEHELAIITTKLKNPRDLGRVLRHQGQIQAIIDPSVASEEVLKIKEINTGALFIKASLLKKYLPQIQPQGPKNEKYLTDLLTLCLENKHKVTTLNSSKAFAWGVNTQKHLQQATKFCFRKKADRLMENGVLIIDPACTYIEDSVKVDTGSVIYPGSHLRGDTVIGSFSVIESNCFLSSVQLEKGVIVKAFSYLENCSVGSKTTVGPFARLREGVSISENCRVGNFVEMKKVQFGEGSKASHHSYLGDAEIGKNVNIGCGTITCNYNIDKKKHKTEIKDGVFVGSDTQFVAPVTIGENAIIGAGSTITKNVPKDSLALSRTPQTSKDFHKK